MTTTTTRPPVYATEEVPYRDVVLNWLNTQPHGATVTEVKDVLDPHHGHTSAALSVLHGEGSILRLAKKRNGCKIYIHPDYYDGFSETEPYGRRAPEVTQDERAEIAGIQEFIGMYDCTKAEADMQFLLDVLGRFL